MWILILLFQISPPLKVQVFDTPNDKGGSISIEWELSPDDSLLSYYEVFRKLSTEEYNLIATPPPGSNRFEDNSTKDGEPYWYKVRAVSPTGYTDSEPSGPVVSSAQWFHHKRWNALILGIIFCSFLLYYIKKAKIKKSLFIRKISGLEAVDEAVGRATELGKSILYLTGLSDMSEISTIASLSILGRVAKKAAEYGTTLIVPCYDPVVMSAAQETVKQAHMEAGRPDTYDESKIFYLTADQFGYAAGVDGIILREKPGAVFLQGYFFAEALILAETGASIGAIQIAGTPATTQLPFFVAACDYTLIGEEMFAASSYLSKEPTMLGSIKGEDYAKIIIMILISIGILFVTLSNVGILKSLAFNFINWFSSF
ncbi:MAG: hypothetical protein QMD71_02770 [bacterium]|nr:hypothetical protein [bacterium]